MNPENINKFGKLKIEGQRVKAENGKVPDKIHFEFTNPFCFKTSVFLPCHINFYARYLYREPFQIRRTATAYDIMYLFDGEVTIALDGKNFTLFKNNAVIVCTDTAYLLQAKKNNTDILIISLSGPIVEEYYKLITQKEWKPISIRNSEQFADIFEKQVFYIRFPSEVNNALAAENFLHLFTQLYISSISEENFDETLGHPKWFVQSVSLIDKNYNKDLSVQKLADECGLSASHLHKLFREYTKMSPYQYLLSVRVDHSKTLLQNKAYSVKYIAYSVGFKSVNLYITHFKKMTGLTPNAFRSYGNRII